MDVSERAIVPCPQCGQRLRLPGENHVALRCPKCQHSWVGAETLDMREQVARALCLVKSEDPKRREEGMRLFRWLYENREKLVANLWQGFKVIRAITMIVLLPGQVGEAAKILEELTE